MPKSQVFNVNVEGKSKQQFKNCHNYNIHSLSISSDREHFISADDLTINLWNMENNWTAYNLIDIKPPDTGDLSEIITYAEFHPSHSDQFIYSSSKAYICICDLRQSTSV